MFISLLHPFPENKYKKKYTSRTEVICVKTTDNE